MTFLSTSTLHWKLFEKLFSIWFTLLLHFYPSFFLLCFVDPTHSATLNWKMNNLLLAQNIPYFLEFYWIFMIFHHNTHNSKDYKTVQYLKRLHSIGRGCSASQLDIPQCNSKFTLTCLKYEEKANKHTTPIKLHSSANR